MQDTELYTMLLSLGSGWRVREVRLDMAKQRVDVWVETVEGGPWRCPECKMVGSIYDHTGEQIWRHLDTCQCRTYVHARLPRTTCKEHGVRQVAAPWAGPRSGFTLLLECRLIDTLKECDVTGCCRLLGVSWDEGWGIVERAVCRGRSRKPHRIPAYLGIDEKSFAKRHNYETLVCDLERGVIEYVVDDRKQESLETYYRQFTFEERQGVKAAAMDIWDPYIAATRAYIPNAEEKIVFDRYHMTRLVSEAVDKVRRQEHKMLAMKGDDRLKGTKYLWLANEENVPEWRQEQFDVIRKGNLRTGRAWAMKEALREFWNYTYSRCAEKFFHRWYFWVTHSRLSPMVKVAKTLKLHLPNILTYFKHRISNATAEGLNSKIQMVKEMACGFRNRDHYKLAIYFHCGGLDLYPATVNS
jgi:Transposase and inactivated derivatives